MEWVLGAPAELGPCFIVQHGHHWIVRKHVKVGEVSYKRYPNEYIFINGGCLGNLNSTVVESEGILAYCAIEPPKFPDWLREKIYAAD